MARSPGKIVNARELATRGDRELRELALRVAGAGLAACDPGPAVADGVAATEAGLSIAEHAYPLAAGARVLVVGSGKATLAIAAALEQRLGDRVDGGAVVVRRGEHDRELARIEVLEADHPLPSADSVVAARRLNAIADSAREGDLVLASFTGGSSALTSLPPAGVKLSEKRRLHELLLACGAPIRDVNTVRKHVSEFKGGRFAARVAPARLVNLTISDVAGDVLETLTDPSVGDSSTVADVRAILDERELWAELPRGVRDHLDSAGSETPTLAEEPQSVVLINGTSVCEAMAAAARAAGAIVAVVAPALEADAGAVGRRLGALALAATPASGEVAVIVGCGGEATVALRSRDQFGRGGPNQEAALALALCLAESAPIAGCLVDTDGSDGGTEFAGAIVDGHTAPRADELGIDLEAALSAHRSGEALATLADRVQTGATGSNVNDLFVVAVRGR